MDASPTPVSDRPTPTQTYGEKLVDLSFNPSGSPEVQMIKRPLADLATLLNDMRSASSNNDANRLFSIAISKIEEASMFGVKAVTRKP